MLYEGWFDGCCEPVNPGGHAAWGAALLRDGKKIWQAGGYCGVGPEMSNNVAEYCGVVALLKEILHQFDMNLRGSVLIRGDSKLVIRQLEGKWRVRGGRYVPFFREADQLAKKLRKETEKNLAFKWVPRDQNGICDVLSKA
jgi:ribonuclease HI